jgi:hypothetical protein
VVFANTATLAIFGNVSFRISSHFSLSAAPAVSDMPVTLPPGRARLVTMPAPTGSVAKTKTMGMTDVACLSAGTEASFVTITSNLSRANSAAISTLRSGLPSDQRYSIAMVRL